MILAGLVYFRVFSVFRGRKRFVLYGLESKAINHGIHGIHGK